VVHAAFPHGRWITLPMKSDQGQIVVKASTSLLQESWSGYGRALANLKDISASQKDKVLVAGLPIFTSLANTQEGVITGSMTEQCARQWVRCVLAHTFDLSVTSDIMVYLMMAL